jgi:GNAT superfamily N-acetyltransferase
MLPDGYILRHPTPDDLPDVQALLDAAESADLGEPCRHDMQIAVVAATSRLDLTDGAWLVVAPDGVLAGAGWLWVPRAGDTELAADHYVHPAYREGPADDLLIDRIEERASAILADAPAATRLVFFCEESNVRRHRPLLTRGYAHVRGFYGMRIDLEKGRPAPEWPCGIEVRTIRPEPDGRLVHAASEEAFAEHYLFGPTPFDEWHAGTVARDDCDPSLWLVAWDGEEVAGQAWAVIGEVNAYVEDLSVRKPWRGRGLGSALLVEAFRLLGDRGERIARLFVDAQNATGALRVYERMGMRVERRIEALDRALR